MMCQQIISNINDAIHPIAFLAIASSEDEKGRATSQHVCALNSLL